MNFLLCREFFRVVLFPSVLVFPSGALSSCCFLIFLVFGSVFSFPIEFDLNRWGSHPGFSTGKKG